MKAFRILAAAVILLTSCNELTSVKVRDMDRAYFIVEAFLTDLETERQSITLSKSISYFDESDAPAVQNAKVYVESSGTKTWYSENPGKPGTYLAPEGFCGKPGESYHLVIEAKVGGEDRTYEAWSTMPEAGFQLDSIDYTYAGGLFTEALDSLWSIAIWGQDKPQTSSYYITAEVNGLEFPYDLSSVIDDKYFAGQKVAGFPITMINQSARNQKMYGDCSKFLERGDVITIKALTLTDECFKFFEALSRNSSGMSIPMFSTQPANCPTNIEGKDAMGFFAACPVTKASREVDDPFRKVFKQLLPFVRL